MRTKGQALAEFALVLPLFAVVLFGIMDAARLFNSWVTIEAAAREGARYGVTGRTDCEVSSTDRVECIEYRAMQRAKGLTDSAANTEVSVRNWQYPAYSDPPTNGSAGDQCDALEVRVEYDFNLLTPLLSRAIGTIHLVAGERMVNEPYGPCDE